MKKRVLYVLQEYPQLSETYIYNEIEHVTHLYELEIFSLGYANFPYRNHRPYTVGGAKVEENLDQLHAAFRPDIVHFHYMTTAQSIFPFCRHYDIPFTIRAHSFDVLGAYPRGPEAHAQDLAKHAEMVNSPLCLGLLTFPFTCAPFIAAGVDERKLVPSFPVVDVKRFYSEAPNGDGVINMGAALGKKDMKSFLRLAALRPELSFSLYAIGYGLQKLQEENEQNGGICKVPEPVPTEAMPAVYKQQRWLVYTADNALKTVGWPMAVAEAQAAGVGVCMANIRPDIAQYVGEGGGILFDDVDDIKDVIAGPVPEAMRRRGFELCWRSDIAANITQLTSLWDGA